MRILIACGGTGGHLFPGLAVAETLANRQHQVKLLVSEKAVDQAALSALTSSSAASAITARAVSAIGYTGSRGWTRFCVRFARAIGECVNVCRQFEPHVILGMGGFTSAPAVVAGNRCRGTATLIHESNAVPGKANRWTGRWADHIAVGLADCAKFFGHKPVTVTGTPIRQALRQGRVVTAHERLGLDRDRLTVLVMGGSQGARTLNEAMIAALPWLTNWRPRMQFVHLSGAQDEPSLRAAYADNGYKANVMRFCNEMELPYSAADLAVTRSGAATLAELAAFGLPAILVPYPQAANDHQLHNARTFERAGAARIVEQLQLTNTHTLGGERLALEITTLLEGQAARAQMSTAARALAIHNADERIANLMETYAD